MNPRDAAASVPIVPPRRSDAEYDLSASLPQLKSSTDFANDLVLRDMLPHSDDPSARGMQGLIDALISGDVPLELGRQ
jgi:hypothetical protein